ncbi:MAG: hypothetical protein ABR518_07335 [Actinomycetota bacterium]
MDHISLAGLAVFLSGLAVGLVIGFALAPVVRLWIAWHEWRDASSQARSTEASLKREAEGPWDPVGARRPSMRPPKLHPDPR